MVAPMTRERAIEATAWFSILVGAKVHQDAEDEYRARAALKEAGIEIKFRRSAEKQGVRNGTR